MLNLVRIELKKIIARKDLFYALLFVVVCMVCYVGLRNTWSSNEYEDEKLQLQKSYNSMYTNINSYREYINAGLGTITLENNPSGYYQYYSIKEEVALLDGLEKKYQKFYFINNDEAINSVYCYVEAKIDEDTETYNKCKKTVDDIYNALKEQQYHYITAQSRKNNDKTIEDLQKKLEKETDKTTKTNLENEIAYYNAYYLYLDALDKYVDDLDNEDQYNKYLLIKKWYELKTAQYGIDVEGNYETYDLSEKELQENEAEAGMLEYLIENDNTDSSKHAYNTNIVKDFNTANILISIMIMFIICSSVSSEFEKGTIKQLLIKPYKRYKILLSKFIAAFIVLLLLAFVQFMTVEIFLPYLVKVDYFSDVYIYDTIKDQIQIMSCGTYFIKCFIAALPVYIFNMLFALWISVESKNIGVSTGFSLLFAGMPSALSLLFQMEQFHPYGKLFSMLIMDCNDYLFGGLNEFAGRDFVLVFWLTLLSILIVGFLAFRSFRKVDVKNQ